MSTELSVKEAALSAQGAQQWTRDQIELVKRTVCKGATDDEFRLFMHVAQKSGLDPFSRQIYAIKRRQGTQEVMQPQTSIDGYRLIAERTHKYMPGPKPTYAYKNDGKLESATAYVKKMDQNGDWHTIDAEAFWDEYAVSYNGKLGHMWEKMPHVMLAKCAESLVIRRAFPAETHGIYTAEEMGRANAEGPVSPAMPQAIDSEVDDGIPEEVNKATGEIPFGEPAPTGTTLSAKQQSFLFGLAKKKGWGEDDIKAYSAKFFGKPNPMSLTSKELDKALTHLKTLPDAANQ